ncbi:MAG TPA: adenosylcobinamide-GDP ribazoletransferase [Candidatus Binatia bacterium]|nr:adenosylcobinamide-GDP ribazoletransferase [Candidatus Binatia bacterium]
MSSFFAALRFLTIFPGPVRLAAADWRHAAIFFPVIGLLLGMILVLVDFPLRLLASPGLCGALLVSILAFLTGGLHLDGLSDTFDGLGAGGDRERMLTVMDDSHVGALGMIAVLLVLILKIEAIQSTDTDRWRVLLAAPILSRWAMVLLGYRSLAAKPGLGSSLIDQLETKHVVLASLVSVILVIAILRIAGIALLLLTVLFTWLMRTYFHRRLGGIPGDVFGAVSELTETFALVFLALGAR